MRRFQTNRAIKALLVVLGCTLLNLPAIPIVFGQTTQLKVVAPTSDITVPAQFNIDITVVDIPAEPDALFAWGIKLYYNPAVLKWLNATYPPGHVFDGKPFWGVSPLNGTDVGGTYILFTATLQGNVPRFSGNGTLCRISFEAKAQGTSALNFSKPLGVDTWLYNYGDPEPTEIPATLVDGSVDVVGSDTRVPSAISVIVAPHSVIAGRQVTINGAINVTVPPNTPVKIEYSRSNMTPFWRPLATAFSTGSQYSYLWKPTSEDDGIWDIRARWDGNIAFKPATSQIEIVDVTPDFDPPVTSNDYEGLWRTTDFTINLTATDDLSGVAETWYRMNGGANKTVRVEGQPRVITENANNTLEYWSVDFAGNEENHTVLKEIKLDKTAPTGLFTINNGATYAGSTAVFLRLSATDATSGVWETRLSNDSVTYTIWQLYAEFKPWFLQDGEGVRTVYLQLMDHAGLVSQVYSQTIMLDTTPPIVSIISPSDNSEIRSSTVTVAWEGSDNASDIDHYELRVDRAFWINVGTNTTQIFTGFGDGSHNVEIKAVNNAGLERVISVRFNVDTSLLFGLGFLEVIGILAATLLIILGVCIYFFKIRKRSIKSEGRSRGKFE